MTERKKPGVAFWATVVLVLMLVGYPVSFGPACWLVADVEVDGPTEIDDAIFVAYYPILWLGRVTRPGPGQFDMSQIDRWVEWYATLCRNDGLSPFQRQNGESVWSVR
jgi:hypothetical protein